MNNTLLEQITRHIFANLSVIYSPSVNQQTTKSLMNKDFLLTEKLVFENDNGKISKNNIWGCQLSSDQQEIKILLGDCTQDKELPEFCLIVQLKGAPAYGVYLIVNDLSKDIDSEPMIALTINQKDWMTCSTYLQATFLAGMEQVKDIGLAQNKCTNYQSHHQLMLSFIKFHHTFYEAKYEGQES